MHGKFLRQEIYLIVQALLCYGCDSDLQKIVNLWKLVWLFRSCCQALSVIAEMSQVETRLQPTTARGDDSVRVRMT